MVLGVLSQVRFRMDSGDARLDFELSYHDWCVSSGKHSWRPPHSYRGRIHSFRPFVKA